LREVANRRVLVNRGAAAVGLFLPGDDAQQSRLSAPIGSDQTDVLSRVDDERDVFEDRLLWGLLMLVLLIEVTPAAETRVRKLAQTLGPTSARSAITEPSP
jgi:hypothetical protein